MLFYRLIIRMYFAFLRMAALFSRKARARVQGAAAAPAYVREHIHGQEVIWMHCSSLGEYEQGRPVLEALKLRFPGKKILLTFFSPSGYEIVKDRTQADFVCYLPDDGSRAMRHFLTQVRPAMVLFVKYDFWFDLLNRLRKMQVPVFFISVVIKERHFLMRRYAERLREILNGAVTQFFVQDEASANRLAAMGFSQVTVAGDTRVDSVLETAARTPSYQGVERWKAGQKVFIGASLWESDEKAVLGPLLQLAGQGWKLILAPHDVSASNLNRLIKDIHLKYILLSDLKSNEFDGASFEAPVLVVDTIGDLRHLYAYGDAAYIGGGFTASGIHNTLEPAVHGLPLIFGPNYQGFIEAEYFVRAGGGWALGKATAKEDFIERLDYIQQESNRHKAGEKNREYIRYAKGATKRTIEKIASLLASTYL